MNYRVNGKNLKRKEIRDIKRAEAEIRNARYQTLSDGQKAHRNPKKYKEAG